MKLFCTLLCFCWIIANANAQNLVPNPSFEEYLECPFSTAELDNQVIDWFAWSVTPDFFHECSNEIDGFAGVPQNAWGHQIPLSGNSYIGLFTYADYALNAREYVASELIKPLAAGEDYYVMFHVSMTDSSEAVERICATNNLGLRFFKDPNYGIPNNGDQPLEPDNFVHVNATIPIDDNKDWTKIEGWFTSDDNYNWLAIGNFFTDDQTQIVILNDDNQCSGIYYIENVCVALNPEECDYLLSQSSERESFAIQILPNPASEWIQVNGDMKDNFHVEVIEISGKVVSQHSNLSSGVRINLPEVSAGIYIVRVFNESFNNTSKIILK